jgi:hypothetical protein
MAPPPAAALPGACGELPPQVQARIQRLVEGSGGMVRLDHFDLRIVDMMQVGFVRDPLSFLTCQRMLC